MPGKTTAETIQEVRIEIAVLGEQFRGLSASIDQANLLRICERLAVLESQVAELKKQLEESERRRWQMTFLFYGSLLTLAIQFALLFLKK